MSLPGIVSLRNNYFFLVTAAFFAEREREAAERFAAALRACRDSAVLDAALLPSRLSTRDIARERFADVFFGLFALLRSRAACSRVSFDALPCAGGGSLTPARRAFDKPMAIACLAERAPCFPSRMCSISSRTNSPACVLGAFPSRLSFLARSITSFSGIVTPSLELIVMLGRFRKPSALDSSRISSCNSEALPTKPARRYTQATGTLEHARLASACPQQRRWLSQPKTQRR